MIWVLENKILIFSMSFVIKFKASFSNVDEFVLEILTLFLSTTNANREQKKVTY